jgi:hypothetical protein
MNILSKSLSGKALTEKSSSKNDYLLWSHEKVEMTLIEIAPSLHISPVFRK